MGSPGNDSGYLREPLDRSHDGEPTTRIMNTERAVARARNDDRSYSVVLKKYYLGRQGIIEIAGFYESTRHDMESLLIEARNCVGRHLGEIEGVI